jgi:aquaporin Z
MNKYPTELIGTFFLMLTIGCTVIGAGTGTSPPLAIGAALMVMIFARGHVSGAHYFDSLALNPPDQKTSIQVEEPPFAKPGALRG